MAERQQQPIRRGTTQRQPPPERQQSRRPDTIRCENCGEDYSTTYKRCPFCDERPGRTGVGGRRVAGGGGRVNPIQAVAGVISLGLICAALFIVFQWVSPFFGKGAPDGSDSSGQGSSTSQPDPSGSVSGSQGGQASSATIDPGGSSGGDISQPQTPVTATVTSVKLNRTDITLKNGETYQFTATVSPAGVSEPVTWTTSDSSLATVDDYGNVTNVNKGNAKRKAVITATCGGQSASSDVYCRPAGTASGGGEGGDTTVTVEPSGPVAPNTSGTVTASSLNVRAEASSSGEKVGSLSNGNVVTILEDTGNGWYRIRYKDITGYVSSQYIRAGS